MTVRRAALVVVLCGCHTVFGIDDVVPGPDSGQVQTGPDSPEPRADAGPPPRLVVSEISVAGLLDTCDFDPTDELVELYNPESTPAHTAGLTLECAAGVVPTFAPCAVLPDAMVPPYGFLLVTGASFPGDSCGYTQGEPDQYLSGSLAESAGAVRLVTAAGTVIDAVAWGDNPGGEGMPISPWPPMIPWSPTWNAIERKAHATADRDSMRSGADRFRGNGYDTNDNLTDFVFRSGREGQRITASPEPPGS